MRRTVSAVQPPRPSRGSPVGGEGGPRRDDDRLVASTLVLLPLASAEVGRQRMDAAVGGPLAPDRLQTIDGQAGLTPGNVADITMTVPLLETVNPPRRLLADRAYDADRLRRWLAEWRITAVIPSTASRRIHTRSTVAPIAAAIR